LSLVTLILTKVIQIVTKVIKHGIHVSQVKMIVGNEIMERGLGKCVEKERYFEFCIFRHVLEECVMVSDCDDMENVPLVRVNCQVTASSSSHADVFNWQMRMKKKIINGVEVGIMEKSIVHFENQEWRGRILLP